MRGAWKAGARWSSVRVRGNHPLVTNADSKAPARGDGREENEVAPGLRVSLVPAGTRVRVLAGSLADQLGIVVEHSEKQGVRVQIGSLGVWLKDSEVELVSPLRDRPMLRSSHRKDR